MFFENPGLSFLSYIIQHMPRKALNCVFAFMCGRAGETILIRYEWTRPMGNVQYKWLSGDPRCLLAKETYFFKKATRHSWVLKTCYYSEKGRKTDGNFNSILKIPTRKDLFITLSILYIQISNNDYLPEFPNILLYVEANLVWMCRKCLYSAVIFNSKLDYFLIASVGKKKYVLSIIIKTAIMLRKLPAVWNWVVEDS